MSPSENTGLRIPATRASGKRWVYAVRPLGGRSVRHLAQDRPSRRGGEPGRTTFDSWSLLHIANAALTGGEAIPSNGVVGKES